MLKIPTASEVRKFQAPSLEKLLGRLPELFVFTEDNYHVRQVRCALEGESEEILSEAKQLIAENYGYEVEFTQERLDTDPSFITGYMILKW